MKNPLYLLASLLLLTIAFLKKLSIFKENKDEMRECNIAPELLAFVPAGHK